MPAEVITAVLLFVCPREIELLIIIFSSMLRYNPCLGVNSERHSTYEAELILKIISKSILKSCQSLLLPECSPFTVFHVRSWSWIMVSGIGTILGGERNILCTLVLYFSFHFRLMKQFISGARRNGNHIQCLVHNRIIR